MYSKRRSLRLTFTTSEITWAHFFRKIIAKQIYRLAFSEASAFLISNKMEDEKKNSQHAAVADIESIFKSFTTQMSENRNGQVFKAKILHTPIGSMIAISNADKLFMLNFLDSKKITMGILRIIKFQRVKAIEFDDGNTKPLKSVAFELAEYFDGHLTVFKTPVHINEHETEYQKAVLQQIADIPYGETSTYAKLAQNMNKPKSYRAVANGCGRNSMCIVIPCHRVLSSGGTGGFSSGIDRKKFLLDLEKKAMGVGSRPIKTKQIKRG